MAYNNKRNRGFNLRNPGRNPVNEDWTPEGGQRHITRPHLPRPGSPYQQRPGPVTGVPNSFYNTAHMGEQGNSYDGSTFSNNNNRLNRPYENQIMPGPVPGSGPYAHMNTGAQNIPRPTRPYFPSPHSNQSPPRKPDMSVVPGNLPDQTGKLPQHPQQPQPGMPQSPGQWADVIQRVPDDYNPGNPVSSSPGGHNLSGRRPMGLPNMPNTNLRKPGSGGSRLMNTPTAGGFRNRFPKKPPNQPGSPNFLRPNNIYEEGY